MTTREEEVRRSQALERRISRQVNALLAERGVPPRDLAVVLGIPYATVRNLLAPGHRPYKWETQHVRAMAAHFEMPVRYFFGAE